MVGRTNANSNLINIDNVISTVETFAGSGTTPFTNAVNIINDDYKYIIVFAIGYTTYYGTTCNASIDSVSGAELVAEISNNEKLINYNNWNQNQTVRLYRVLKSASDIVITVTGQRGSSSQNYAPYVDVKTYCMK